MINLATLNTESEFVCATFLLNSCMEKRKNCVFVLDAFLIRLVWTFDKQCVGDVRLLFSCDTK